MTRLEAAPAPPAGCPHPDGADAMRHLPALDGLRGLAALAVLCFHVVMTTDPRLADDGPPPLRFAVTSMGAHAVGCFFVLSAFLLAAPFLRWVLGEASRPDMRRYALHRVLRIYPAWWVTLAVMGVAVAPWLAQRPGDLLLFAGLGQNYAGLGHRVVPHGWTLVVEVSFYVVLPLAAAAAVRLLRGRRRETRAAAVAAALVAMTVASWAYQLGFLPGLEQGALGASLPQYLDRFALGTLAALVLLLVSPRHLTVPALLLAAVAAWLSVTDLTRERYQVMSLGFALLILHLAGGRGPLARILATAPMRRLGLLSYGIYLYHLPLKYLAVGAGILQEGAAWQTLPAIAGLLAASALAAELSYRMVEAPALRLARELSGRRAPARRPVVRRPARPSAGMPAPVAVKIHPDG